MARKRYRSKKRRCALCKPSKRGWAIGWSSKERRRLKTFEKCRDQCDWAAL